MNMVTELKDNSLIIKIDISGKRYTSKGGKMEMIASTSGFTPIAMTKDGRTVKLNLNCGVTK